MALAHSDSYYPGCEHPRARGLPGVRPRAAPVLLVPLPVHVLVPVSVLSDFSCARKQERMHNATPSSPLVERDATEAPPQVYEAVRHTQLVDLQRAVWCSRPVGRSQGACDCRE